jgi:hypothetical protein
MKETILLEVVGYILSTYGVMTVTSSNFELRHQHRLSHNNGPDGMNPNH